MLGWKTLTYDVPSAVSDDSASETLRKNGFVPQETSDQRLEFKRSAGDGAPALPVAATLDCGREPTQVAFKYAAFVAFDTGDLQRFADDVMRSMRAVASDRIGSPQTQHASNPYRSPAPSDEITSEAKEAPTSGGSLTWGIIGIIIGCLCTFGSIIGFAKNGIGVGTAGLLFNLAFGLFMLISGGANLKLYFGKEKKASDA